MRLTGKIIFIISYENWGPMLMSKHHYAIELSKAGNTVYFINHPDRRKSMERGNIKLAPTSYENLFVVEHRLFYPYFLKFKFKSLFNLLTRLHISRVIKKIGMYPDVVWSFDTGNTIPLRIFNKSKIRILMPVDGPFGHIDEFRSAEAADVIVSVTQRILDVFSNIPVPKFLINHGVADVFLKRTPRETDPNEIRVGYSGSLIRNDLDTNVFLHIIKRYPNIIFEFWGEHDPKKSNIHLPQDVTKGTLEFLKILKEQPNVILHGPVSSEDLAKGIQRMDVLLICYNIKNDQNHHKVLEYLGTGNVIISNYMNSYRNNNPGLLEMVESPDNNSELPVIFERVVNDLSYYNSEEFRLRRMNYAREFSYANNIIRIEKFVENAEIC